MNKEAYRKSPKASRKPQGSYRNFQGRIPCNIFVAILENRCPHKFILSLTDLYLGFKRCEMHEERDTFLRVMPEGEKNWGGGGQ